MPTLEVVAVNIRSAQNVGALFRTADALGVNKIWLTGYSPTPEHSMAKKTALGAETTVPWEHVTDPIECLERLRRDGTRLVALETAKGASDLAGYVPQFPMALVVGNEVEGLTAMQLARCDDIVSIRQRGQKESLNVAIATAITAYVVLNR
ncbi:MAG TPA: TrmH family RNA methyltransferase [Candidatus Methylomirabilis sp.]|nr:TrmH family RNA methyltransferase [Candidatus Methylomirabilis sp.]